MLCANTPLPYEVDRVDLELGLQLSRLLKRGVHDRMGRDQELEIGLQIRFDMLEHAKATHMNQKSR